MKVLDVQAAIAVVDERRHWLYKQASEELETAVLTLLAYAKERQAIEKNRSFTMEQLNR